jgi:hypothetical protein
VLATGLVLWLGQKLVPRSEACVGAEAGAVASTGVSAIVNVSGG